MEHNLYPPRKRNLNNDSTDDFVAIDFETMTQLPTSACALGMVKVIDGEIVQQYYSIINPVRDDYTDKEPNRTIHGISLVTAEKADSFDLLFAGILEFIGDYPIVCHNKGMDINVLRHLMEYYGLSGLDLDNVCCTYQLTGMSLSECCKEYGIPESKHHNALWDAEACAKVFLELIGKPLIDQRAGHFRDVLKSGGREISKEARQRLDESEIENKDTPFFNASVVITGLFDAYPDRNELACRLQKLGAKVNSSISKKTSIVIVGEGAGPKKMDKIASLREEGYDIRIMREKELCSILD